MIFFYSGVEETPHIFEKFRQISLTQIKKAFSTYFQNHIG